MNSQTRTSRFTETVKTADGSLTIAHPEHGETFHSRQGAAFEADALYVSASGLRDQLQQGSQSSLRVLDVGLGLGYNAMATLVAWWQAEAPPPLAMLSLESETELVESLLAGNGAWMPAWPTVWQQVAQAWEQVPTSCSAKRHCLLRHPSTGASAQWLIQIGDARQTEIAAPAEAWNYVWQDPFSPQHNPDMWSAEWFRKLRPACDASTILVTYSVARRVRDALTEAGFVPERFPAAGQAKRHWLRARCAIENSIPASETQVTR